jgi:hypothetical protein
MTAPLTPQLALAYLRELSVDVRAAVVLDPEGSAVAGDTAIASRARDAIPGDAAVVSAAGGLLVARTPDGGAIAVLAGDFALVPLLEHDLATVAQTLPTTLAELPGSRDSQ